MAVLVEVEAAEEGERLRALTRGSEQEAQPQASALARGPGHRQEAEEVAEREERAQPLVVEEQADTRAAELALVSVRVSVLVPGLELSAEPFPRHQEKRRQ
jgi:hypothetical protein